MTIQSLPHLRNLSCDEIWNRGCQNHQGEPCGNRMQILVLVIKYHPPQFFMIEMVQWPVIWAGQTECVRGVFCLLFRSFALVFPSSLVYTSTVGVTWVASRPVCWSHPFLPVNGTLKKNNSPTTRLRYIFTLSFQNSFVV